MKITYLLFPYLIMWKNDFYGKKLVVFILGLCYLPITIAVIAVLVVIYFLSFCYILISEILKKIMKLW